MPEASSKSSGIARPDRQDAVVEHRGGIVRRSVAGVPARAKAPGTTRSMSAKFSLLIPHRLGQHVGAADTDRADAGWTSMPMTASATMPAVRIWSKPISG